MGVNREIIVSLAAAVLGTAVVELIKISTEIGLIEATTITLSTFIFLLTAVNSQDTIFLALERPGKWRISGGWETRWTFKKSIKGKSISVIIEDSIALKQWGTLVYGHGRSTAVSGPSRFPEYEYKFRGRVNKEGIIEGRFENTNKMRNYYGIFQLKIERNCTQMSGVWVGVGRQKSHTGDWVWERAKQLV